MRDFVTDAIVLSIEPSKEYDRSVFLFTKDLGLLKARVTSGARILSKFSPHLDPLNLARVRLAHKNGFTLTDALTEERFPATRNNVASFGNALRTIALIKALAAEHEPDEKLWQAFIEGLTEGTVRPNTFLKLFGYDARHTECDSCGRVPAHYFAVKTHTFWCASCSTRMPENALLLI